MEHTGNHPRPDRRTRARLGVTFTLCVTVLTGCHWDMWDDARYKPLEPAPIIFGEGQSSSRTLVPESVPYGQAHLDTIYYQGKNADGTFAAQLPREVELTRETLLRGMDRYMVYCMPCHGYTGTGDGMIVRRGFPAPPSYHIDRLREAEVGYFFDVITNGFGRMYGYATRVSIKDRWAIAAYLRALQLSQAGTTDTLLAQTFNEIKTKAHEAPDPAADDHGGGHGAAEAHGDVTHDDGDAGHDAAAGEAGHGEAAHGEEAQHGNTHGSEH